MIDNKIANNLIEWIRKINYYKMFPADGRECAIEDLRKIRELYGWEAMKKAYKHSNCTSIGNFRMLCKELKQSLENLLKISKIIEDHLQKERESAKVEPLQTLGGVAEHPPLKGFEFSFHSDSSPVNPMLLTINTTDNSYTINNEGKKITIEDLVKAETKFSEAVNSVMKEQPLILIEKPKPLPLEK